MSLLRRTAPSVVLILLFALISRILALPGAQERNMTPDGARFLNLARELQRGAGYVTPEGGPAWMLPQHLPAPETFKEPAYAYGIAALTPLAGDAFRAGQWISLVAGVLLPLVTYALVRALEADLAAAAIAGLFAAASPVLILQSVFVMADSLFALMLTLAFALAARRRPDGAALRLDLAAAAAGAAFAIGLLVRAQAIIGLPSLLWLLLARRVPRERFAALAIAGTAAAVVLLPYAAHSLRAFGTAFHSDVLSVGLLPYVDPVTFTHSLERPPAAFAWMLAHPRAVLAHVLIGLRELLAHVLPGYLVGQRAWLVPMAAGVVVAWRARERWGFAMLFAAVSLAGLLPLAWLPRYFTALVPFAAAATSLGLLAIAGWLASAVPLARRWSPLALTLLLLALAPQVLRTRAGASATFAPEMAAAREYGPWLRARLAPGDAVMCETTSYWAWYSDRPAVYLPICDEVRFTEIVSRLRVRWVALPVSRLAEFSRRYPAGRLPGLLDPVLEDRGRDVAIFRIRAGAAIASAPAPGTKGLSAGAR